VKADLDLGDGELSVGLLAFAAGAITGMQAMGRLADRYGSARLMVPVLVVDGVLLVGPAFATGLWTLVACLFAFGAAHGMVNIAMNTRAVEVERAWRRPIMTSFHAVYSVGGFVGAAIGGIFAAAGLGVLATFASVAAVAGAVAVPVARWTVRPAHRRPAASRRTGSGRPAPGVLFLGVLVFCCLVGEGAAADWSAVYLREGLGTGPGFAASGYAAFAVMMMVGRLFGDRLAVLVGPVRLVRACGGLAALGLALGLAVHHPLGGLIGFGCLGAGLSCIAPQVFSAAGGRDPDRAGQSIARVASLGFVGFVVGPIVIGAAAEVVGLRWALFIPAVLALFVALTATAVRPPAGTPAGTPAGEPDPVRRG
jgi:MFS family permease